MTMAHAFFALNSKLFTILDHCWPEMSLISDFLHQSASAAVVNSGTFMNFFHHIDGFVPV